MAILMLFTNQADAQAYKVPKTVTPQIQIATARKIPLEISCGKPRPSSIRRRGGMMVFTLFDGDIGQCYTDKDADYSADYVAYMERAELSSHKNRFRRIKTYRVSALFHMDPDAASAHNTTIFQIHQWDTDDCKCGPPLMMSFDAKGRLRARILRAPGKHKVVVLKGWARSDFEDKWVEIAVDIGTSKGLSDIRIHLAGQTVFTGQALIRKAGALFFKTGLYREGIKGKQLPRDRVFVKKAKYAVLN